MNSFYLCYVPISKQFHCKGFAEFCMYLKNSPLKMCFLMLLVILFKKLGLFTFLLKEKLRLSYTPFFFKLFLNPPSPNYNDKILGTLYSWLSDFLHARFSFSFYYSARKRIILDRSAYQKCLILIIISSDILTSFTKCIRENALNETSYLQHLNVIARKLAFTYLP